MTLTTGRLFDSTVPAVIQPDDYSCSISTATWCVQSVGLAVDETTMRSLMLPGLVSTDLGLLDGSGGALARLLRERFGLAAQNQTTISFDEAASRAGRQPLALGGHNWSNGTGHWVGVRHVEHGALMLMNPGGTGPRFGQQSLDRSAFDRRAPFSAVWIEIDGEAGGVPGQQAAPVVGEVPFVAAGRFRVVRTDGAGVVVREQPFQGSRQLGAISEAATVEGAEFAWRLIRTEAGLVGWLAAAYLDGDGERLQVVRTEGLGALVREQPSRDGHRLGGVAEGGIVTGVQDHAFRQVRTDGGILGWSADTYLEAADGPGSGSQDGQGEWTLAVGAACATESFWDPDGQPHRRAAMERFNRLPRERRRAIFELALDDGLTAEAIFEPGLRDRWKAAMRAVVLGGPSFPGECPDLNPFMLAGESGGVFRGGADPAFGGLNSSALGYFQFLAQHPIPLGQPFSPSFDYGHWRRYGPFPDDYARQTEPVSQVRQFIRAVRVSRKHGGDPLSVVREKSTPPHIWGP